MYCLFVFLQLRRVSDRNSAETERWSVRAAGLSAIVAAFEQLQLQRPTCLIRDIEAEEAENGGILVLVTGCLKHTPDSEAREFAQTVLLAKMKPPRAVRTLNPKP